MTAELQAFEEIEQVSGGLQGAISADLLTYLNVYAKEHNLGTVFNADTEFELPGIGRRKPDVAFASFQTVPEVTSDVVAVPPDLAVEVVSKTDQTEDIDVKILEYQQAQVKLIWIIRTVKKVIEVYHVNDFKPQVFDINDKLSGESVIPGFELPVSKLFGIPNAKWCTPQTKR
jgi:Uma2 family endonuclease